MVDLTCPMTTEALKLDVHVQGDEFLDFKNFVVVYRVYFRLMSSNLNTRFLNPLPSNSQETILLQIEDDKPTVFTPKALKWDEITIPNVIELQEPQITAQIERRDIEQIIEEPDGKVVLKFRSLSCRDDPSLHDSSNFRRSFSDIPSQTGNLDPSQRYRFRSPIPEPIIDPPSPSSSGIGNTINMLTKVDFTINWSLLKIDYDSDKHSALRKWLEVIDFTLREQIKKEWIADMERLRVSIPFFLWFPTFTSKHGISDPYSKPSLTIQNILYNIWPNLKDKISRKSQDDFTTVSSNSILLDQIQQQLNALDDIPSEIKKSISNSILLDKIQQQLDALNGNSSKDQEPISNSTLLDRVQQQIDALNKKSSSPPSNLEKDKEIIQNKNQNSNENDPSTNKKKQIRSIKCYKCGQIGHKANQCIKTKSNIDNSQINKDTSNEKNDITNKHKVPSIKAKSKNSPFQIKKSSFKPTFKGRTHLQKLSTLISKENDKTPLKVFSSLANIYKPAISPNLLQKIPAKQIQQKINQINSDIKLLKNEVVNLKSIKDLALTNTPNELSNIKQSTITFQNWFSKVTLVVEDFSKDLIALIDSGADTNCIKQGIVPTKYCEKSKESLASVDGTALIITLSDLQNIYF